MHVTSGELGDQGIRPFAQLLTKDEIKYYSQVDSKKFLIPALLEVIVIALAIWVSETYWNPLLYFFAVLLIGARLHGLAVLMHDATHYRAVSNRKLNDLLGEALALVSPISMEGYRNNHFAHHRELNSDKDPDWIRTRVPEYAYPKPKKDVIILLLQYLFGLKTLREMKEVGKEQHLKDVPMQLKVSRVVLHSALILSSIIFGFWKLVLLYWIVPLLTSFVFFVYVRSVSEHYTNLKYENVLNHSRTVVGNPFELWLFGPHGINYHIEHHLYPSVPFYRLAELHRYLMTKPIFAQHAHITKGYLGLFRESCTPAAQAVSA